MLILCMMREFKKLRIYSSVVMTRTSYEHKYCGLKDSENLISRSFQ